MEQGDSRAALALMDAFARQLSAVLREPRWWPIARAAVTAHLDGQGLGVTALADASGLARSTARDVIHAMKAEGLLVFQPVSRTGRRFQVVPSSRLLDSFRRMSDDTIRLVLGSVRDGAFDAQALAPHRPGQPDIGYPQACARGFDRETRISLCTYSDPVFDLLRRNREEIELFTGCRLRIASWPQDTYRDRLHEALAGAGEVPDIVAVPFPWLAELVAEHLLLDLDACLAASPTLTATDHYPQVWHAGQVHARSFGIPIQPTVDFLWYRKDLFDRLGLEPPRTFADVLDCARVLHHPARNQAGIVWNAAPGVAIVETFLQILGAQTGSPADLGEGDPVRSSGTSSTVAGRGPGEPGRDHPGCQFEPAGPVR